MIVRIKSKEQIDNMPDMHIESDNVHNKNWGIFTMTCMLLGKTIEINRRTGQNHTVVPYEYTGHGWFVYDECIDEIVEQ